ncbi:paraquat-inducible protein A [Ketogulonicigenium vulgare]|uniref:paraquat-inducible protein A n=1 Tax=Ketogulonicigenium vulgare TaxID=92945 RepID=UPI0001E67F0E|nr:paraquat-inducible protein A [Ketogulonicigenium vulgare]ADO43417.1 Paraquat-inducible protein A [Ketogulonicigenium vulgare Y25]ALJ81811.1 paraquat-inducible protein A [Ketogulonicigenium vulgare]AOZ55453.1 Paraquat-inducible protein A [Ketogulonicigenium vulgare]
MPPHYTDAELADLVACPRCDALYHARIPEKGERAVCARCHTVLIAPKRKAGMIIIMLAVTVVILVIGALVFPFMSISASGFSNQTTLIEVALSFQSGLLVAVSLIFIAAVILLPLTRAALILYVLGPVVWDRPPLRWALPAFRLSEELRPWAMSEIFVIGCAVALVKVTDLASVSIGPAFWMFAVLCVVTTVQDLFMSRWMVWQAMEDLSRKAKAAGNPTTHPVETAAHG